MTKYALSATNGQARGTYRHFNIDETDISLITELEANPGQTQSEIASKLGLSRATVQARLRKLYESRVIRTVAIADPIALGNTTCVLIGINTLPGRMIAVAEQLANSTNVQHLMLCMGRFDIFTLALFRKRSDFLDFLVSSIGRIDGVTHVETMLTLKHVKLMGPLLSDDSGSRPGLADDINLDSLDLALIRELEVDATQNTRFLADKLETSQSTVLRKLQKLQDDQIIRIAVLIDPFALGYEGVASIGIRCDAAQVNETAYMIASHRNVRTVAICTGRYDIIAWVMFRELNDLSEFVMHKLSQIPGLQHSETMTNLKILKTSHKLTS
jgi:Lrp/AsnC family transcriptional regulator for asnA, asnC and gidA